MKILINHDRKLFENWNFYKNGRLVFGADLPSATQEAGSKAEPKPDEAPKPATPLANETFEAQQKKYEENIAALEKANPTDAAKNRADFQRQMDQIKTDYATRLQALGDAKDADKEAAKKVAPQVESLIVQINTRIEAAKQADITKAEGILDKAGIKPENRIIASTLEDCVKTATKDGKKVDDYKFFQLNDPKVFLAVKKDQTDGLKKLVDAKITTDIPDVELNAAKTKVEQDAKATPPAAEKKDGAVELTPALQTKALEAIAAKFKIVDAALKKRIESIIPKLGLTADQVKQLDSKKLELTPEQTKKIREALPPRLFRYDSARGEMIHNQLTDDAVSKKAGISNKAADIIDDLFDRDDDPLRQYLVQRYDFKAIEGGGIWLTDDSGTNIRINDVKGLTPYLPADAQDNFTKLLALKDTDEPEDVAKRLAESGTDGLKTLKAMQELSAMTRDPRGIKGFEKMGIGETIATLAQLWKMFQEAMKSGDFQTLNDGLNDFNAGLNPNERIKTSKEKYDKEVATINDTGKLLSLYAEPYGTEAKKLFSENEKALPYRIQLKTAVKERFGKELNMDITEMDSKNTKEVKIRGTRNGTDCRIYLERRGATTLAKMEEIKLDKDGKERPEIKVQNKEVKDLASGEKNLQAVLFEDKAAGDKPTDTVETTGAPKGVKEKFGTTKDRTIILKAINKEQIQDVFEKDVVEATIKLSTDRQGFKKGTEVNVKKGKEGDKDTYVISSEGTENGKRLKIQNGDVVTKTTLSPPTIPGRTTA